MGLGSDDNKSRETFKSVASKRDWKADVKTPADAQAYIESVCAILKQDPNGQLLIDAYMHNKFRILREYIKDVDGMAIPLTLKEWSKKNG